MFQFNRPVAYGHLLKRHQRFFMEVMLDSGEKMVAHAPNTGSLTGVCEEGRRVLVTCEHRPTRSTRYTVQAFEIAGKWVGINTQLPNKILLASLDHPTLAAYARYKTILPEVRYGEEMRSRVDFLLTDRDDGDTKYLELKNVTLKIDTQAQFPDTPSVRARKHLHELLHVRSQGMSAELLFIVQRQDCETFSPARHVDSIYADLLLKARDHGIKIRAVCSDMDSSSVFLTHEIPCLLD